MNKKKQLRSQSVIYKDKSTQLHGYSCWNQLDIYNQKEHFQHFEKITSIFLPSNASITLVDLLTGYTKNFFDWYTIVTGQILLYSGRKNTNYVFWGFFWKRVKLYKYENTFFDKLHSV